jgi:hypothetical protein
MERQLAAAFSFAAILNATKPFRRRGRSGVLDSALPWMRQTLVSEWFAAGLDLLRKGLRRPGSLN